MNTERKRSGQNQLEDGNTGDVEPSTRQDENNSKVDDKQVVNKDQIVSTFNDSQEVTNFPTKRRKRYGKDPNKTLNIAVSSRALFSLDGEHDVFLKQGLEQYIASQVRKENESLKPGSAFPFIKALGNVNDKLRELNPEEEELITVTLMSKNNAQVGIRLQKSVDSYADEGLKIQRMALTDGTSPVDYLDALKITLFLTCEEHEVKAALERGFPAAVMSTQTTNPPSNTQLRVAFDLDAVLFSDQSEMIYKQQGLDAMLEHEKKNRDNPLPEGPLKPFALALGKIKKKFARCVKQTCPIRTFLVTARDAEVGERALKTLRSWELEIDESFFMAGAPKNDILRAINPHIFFDDQRTHIDGARQTGTPSGHVPSTTNYDKNKRQTTKTKLF